MDYQTKITIDADKAIRDIEKLKNVFKASDDVVNKYSDALKELTLEQKRLENQVKRTADAELSAGKRGQNALKERLSARSKLTSSYSSLNAKIKNESANLKHSSDMSKIASKSVNGLSIAYKKYGISLDGTNVFMKRAYGNASLFTQKQRELASASRVAEKALLAQSVATKKYSKSTRIAVVANKEFALSSNLVNQYLKVQLVLFRTAMAAYTAYSTINLYVEFNKTAESVDLLSKKLEIFTGESDALDYLKTSAMKTGFAIGDLGKIVTRFAVTTNGAFSTETLTKWTEGLIISGRAIGTTTQEMNNALVQLSQSFSSGFLMGDEYRSIAENLPLFKKALRDTADEAGLANISLKELSSGRKLDIDLLTKALQKLSEESLKYVFALDTIEGAQGRVKVSWEIFAASVADSESLKNTFNYIAGVFAYLSKDSKIIEQFAKQFPKLNSAAEATASILESINRASDFLIDSFSNLIGLLSDTASAFIYITKALIYYKDMTIPVVSAIIAYKIATYEATAASVAFGASLGTISKALILLSTYTVSFKIGEELKEEYQLIEEAGVYLVEGIMYVTNQIVYYWELALLKIDLYITKIIERKDNMLEGAAYMLDSMNFDSAAEGLRGLKTEQQGFIKESTKIADAIELLDAKNQKTLNTMKNIFREQNKYNEQVRNGTIVENDNKTKNIKQPKDTIGQSQKLLESLLKTYDKSYVANKKYEESMGQLWKTYEDGIINLKEFNRMEAIITKTRDDSIKSTISISTAEKKLIEDRERSLELLQKYNQEQNKNTNKIAKLKNPYSTEIDNTSDIKNMEKQLITLNKIRELNNISEEEYAKRVSVTIETTKELIALKQEEHLRKLGEGYDEVLKATNEYAKAEEELTVLLDKKIISVYAYNKALYESERALTLVKAKSGEMAETEQFFKGFNDGLYDFANNSKTVFEEMSELTTRSFNSMTDELTEFVTTGKADFKGLVDSIVKDLTRIAIQKSITEPLAGALFGGGSSGGSGLLGGLLGGLGGIGTAMSLGTNIGSQQTAMLASQWENGGAFNNGNVIPFANGGVVGSPTLFPMANGAGLMGEAGPEAIIPLKRGKDGKLGVQSEGNTNSIVININVSGTNGDPDAIRRSAGQVAQAAGNATSRAMRRNG